MSDKQAAKPISRTARNTRKRKASGKSTSSSSSSRSRSRKNHSRSRSRSRKNRSKSRSRSRSNTRRSRSRNRSRSGSRSRSRSCDSREFEEEYCFYKRHLLHDPELMLAGSDAFTNLYNTSSGETIAENAVVPYSTQFTNLNVEYPDPNGTVYVRKDGVYLVQFNLENIAPCQFDVYVNEVPRPTTTGTNAGAGQLVGDYLIPLRKGDSVAIRNHSSSITPVVIPVFAGGSAVQANVQFILIKIAPYPCENEYKSCHVSERRKKFYSKLEHRMLEDPQLMIKGFNVHGTFFTENQQSVAIEAPILYDQHRDVSDLTHVLGSGDIVIEKPGVYRLFGTAATDQNAQVTFFVNGSAVPSTTVGTNKGAGVIISVTLIELKKGDVIQFRNHTTAIPITLSLNPGGLLTAITSAVTVIKIAPPCFLQMKDCPDKYDEPRKVCEFKNWLLNNKHLQVAGASAFASLKRTAVQTLNIGDSIIWEYIPVDENVRISQGRKEVCIEDGGVYYAMLNLVSDQPCQFSLFINGKFVPNTTFGQSSGASRCAICYTLELHKGDVLTLNNWKSSVLPTELSENAGGWEVSYNASFILFRLSGAHHEGKKC